MREGLARFEEFLTPKTPVFYYDIGKKEYFMKQTEGSNQREWVPYREPQITRALTLAGVPNDMQPGAILSPIESMLQLASQDSDRSVHYSGPLAGYPEGVTNSGNSRVLVTSGPRILKPADEPGDWSLIRCMIEGLLGERNGVQLPYFYAWLQLAYLGLRQGERKGMPAVVLCGARDCGKTQLQMQIITPILGGRFVDPYPFMSGADNFNKEMIGSEHLMISDPPSGTDLRARRKFGDAIKAIVANPFQRIRGICENAITVTPFWRLTISLNDEAEKIVVLPPVDGDMFDKMMLFHARWFDWIVPVTTSEEKRAADERIARELPYFLRWLMDWQAPKEIVARRWTLQCYHDPDVMARLNEVSPEFNLLSLIGVTFTTPPVGTKLPYIDVDVFMTAEEIYAGLTANDSPASWQARQCLSGGSNKVSTYLHRINKKFPDYVYQTRSAKARKWVLRDISGVLERAYGLS